MVSTESSLCQSCRHASGCTLHQASGEPIMECEEFELPWAAAGREGQPVRSPIDRSPAADPELLGLCQNCRVRPGCRLPRPEGGIWFCEEYEVE